MSNHTHLKDYRFLFTYILSIFACGSSFAIEPKAAQMYDEGMVVYSADAQPFLGFSDELTLWEGGVVRLSYNHAGARSDIIEEEIIARIQEAFSVIENIAEVDFQFLGTSTSDPFNFNDEIVTIGWQEIGGSTIARAGPASSAFNSTIRRLGYLPAIDGSFVFNSLFESDYEVATMVHELMHLLGIGHSDTPISIMTPTVTRYDHPQADDIAVLQAMYGPADTVSVTAPTVNLSNNVRSGLTIDASDSGLFFRKADEQDANSITQFENIDGSFESGDNIFLRLNYSGGIPDEPVEVFITDPNGYTSRDADSTLSFDRGVSFFFAGFAGTFTGIPGDWLISVGIDGGRVLELTMNVADNLDTSNRNPIASLSATNSAFGNFNLVINAEDPEGDNIIFDWHVPGEGVFTNFGPTFNLSQAVTTPIKVLAAIRDDGIKRDGLNSGDGFGALLSQYLVTPAEANTPTYFVQEQILHIPSLAINGQLFSINFELTGLAGAQFKFLELFPSANTSATSTLDLVTAVLTIPRIIVQDNGANSVFQNLQFDLVPNSNPIKFSLRL